LIEIMVGAVAGNIVGLTITDWVNFLAGFGAILLTFLAGTEIDSRVIRKHLGASVGIGIVSFLAPYLGVLLYAHYLIHWPWPQAQIAGISMSTTSVAVVYAVMVETGFNKAEIGKIILAGCFVTDLGTVLALGVVFAHFDLWLALFGGVTAVVLWLLPRFAPWFFTKVGHRVSEPETKFISLILLALGGLASIAGSEAVLPAYLVGMALAPAFLADQELPHRMRIVAFTYSDTVLLSQSGFAGRLPCCDRVGRADPGFLLPENGDQVHRRSAAYQGLRLREEGRHVYDPAHVDRPHLRHDFGALRPDKPHH
jgi:Kef-type K+ transport systems, membrane components